MLRSASVIVLGALAGTLVLSVPAHAQRDPAARADYLRTQNRTEQATAVKRYVLEELRKREMGSSAGQRVRTANFFSFVLTVSGVTLDVIERLEDRDVDVIHAITAQSRPLIEQALLADLVAVGRITAVDTTTALADEHAYGLTVAVETPLKGTVPADTLLIRQKERISTRSPDPRPEVGERFLFLASNGLYRYYAWKGGEAPADSVLRRRYSIYRRYRLRDGRLLWRDQTRQQTQRAFQRVRTLDRWLRAWTGS